MERIQPAMGEPGIEGYAQTYLGLQANLMNRYGLEARDRFVDLEGIGRVHLLEAGTGPPVVILHGGRGIGAEHIPIVAPLARRFRVILPDRPGHGLSDDFDYRRCDLRQANVDFLAALLDALAIERAAVVGNSYGGFMAVCFALAHPERVSRLVILSFFPGIERHIHLMLRLLVTPVVAPLLRLMMGRESASNTRKFFSKLMVAHIDRMPEELVELETLHSRRHRGSLSGLFPAMLTASGVRPRYVIGEQLSELRVPTSFVWGDRDAFMSVAPARAAAQRVPGAHFVVIEDAGHLPSTDQPEATAALLAGELGAAEAAVQPSERASASP